MCGSLNKLKITNNGRDKKEIIKWKKKLEEDLTMTKEREW